MITKYKTNGSKDEIKKVEVVRETDKCVFLKIAYGERRENKLSLWGNYFDTWEKAHEFLLECAHKAVAVREMQFEDAMKKRLKIEAIKEL